MSLESSVTVEVRVARELLEDALAENTQVSLRGHSLQEIFDLLVGEYPVNWKDLAQCLDLKSSEEAEVLIRTVLPRLLAQNPNLMSALAIAAGADIPIIKGASMVKIRDLPYIEVPEARRLELTEQFQEEFSSLVASTPLGEILVEFTGSPQGLVLLHLVQRFFRRRFLIEVYMPRLPEEQVPGLADYQEKIRAFYNLDPINVLTADTMEAFELEGTEGFLEAMAELLALNPSGRSGWSTVLTGISKGDPLLHTTDALERQQIRTISFLDSWSVGELLSYIDLQRMEVFEPVALSMLMTETQETPQKSSGLELSEWSREDNKRRFFRYKGKLVKQGEVPDDVIEHFKVLDSTKALADSGEALQIHDTEKAELVDHETN